MSIGIKINDISIHYFCVTDCSIASPKKFFFVINFIRIHSKTHYRKECIAKITLVKEKEKRSRCCFF